MLFLRGAVGRGRGRACRLARARRQHERRGAWRRGAQDPTARMPWWVRVPWAS